MYREGQTATNPKTGQKIVYKGGQWVNAGAPTAAPSARRLAPREQMQLDEVRTAARSQDEAARMAEQFVDINTRQGSGQLWAIPGVAKVAGAFDPDIAQMNALTSKMAPAQRVPGSGTTSDRDLSLFLQAVPGMDRPGPANAAIAKQARADAKRRQDYAAFLDRWASEKGTLLGAEEAWQNQQRQPNAFAPAKPAARAQPKAPAAQGKGWKVLSVE